MLSKRAISKVARKVFRGATNLGGDGFVPIRAIAHSPPKKCIFCGATPLTGEHVWPDWLRKHLPRDMASYKMLRAEVRDLSARGRVGVRGGDIHHRKVKCVCETHCNNGWMRELENRVEPVLSKMLTGAEIRLTEENQRTLAAWFALKAVVSEYDFGAPRISTYRERQALMTKKQPSSEGWRILVGHYQRDRWPGHWVNCPLSIVEKIEDRRERAVRKNSQSLTFVVGTVYMLLLRSAMPGLVGKLRLGPAHDKLRQIWPLSGVSFCWPPPPLTDGEAAGMADFLLNRTLSIVMKKRQASD